VEGRFVVSPEVTVFIVVSVTITPDRKDLSLVAPEAVVVAPELNNKSFGDDVVVTSTPGLDMNNP
jgi:hypothetical protein